MSVVFILNLFILSFLLQSTLLKYATVAGVRPDLIILLACLAGLFFGRRPGLLLGALAGLIQDCLSGTPFGLNTLSKALVGFAAGVLQQHAGMHHRLLQMAMVALLTLFDATLTLGLVTFYHGGGPSLRPIAALIASQALFNALVAAPYFAALTRVARRYLPSGGFTDLPAAPPGLRQLLQRSTYRMR